MSRVEILRALVIEKMTVAVQEILAVVETTVGGYESEVLLLKKELGQHKKQLHAVFQPQVRVFRIAVEDDGGAPQIVSTISSAEIDKDKLKNNFKATEIQYTRESEHCEKENGSDGVSPDVSHGEILLANEESLCTLTDQHNDDSVSRPSNRERGLKNDTIDDVQSTEVKRRRQLPERYRSDNCDMKTNKSVSRPSNRERGLKDHTTDDVQNTEVKRRRLLPERYKSDNCDMRMNNDNDRKHNKYKRLRCSAVKQQPLIKLRVGLLKNGSEKDLSNNVIVIEGPVQTILCEQNISEPDFIRQLRSTFPELGNDKPFHGFLGDTTNRSLPNLTNRITHHKLYTTFRANEQKQFDFYIQLKEQDDTIISTASTVSDDQPTTSGLEEEKSTEIGGTSELTNEQDLSSTDSAGHNEDDVDDSDFEDGNNNSDSEEQSDADEENSAVGKSVKKRKKYRPRKIFSDSCKVCGYLFASQVLLIKHAHSHVDDKERNCGACGQQQESSEKLKKHLETHQKLHHCDICGLIVVTAGAFKRHIATHKTGKSDSSNISKCQNDTYYSNPKSFSPQQPLHKHSRTHKGDKTHKCDQCNKCFVKFRALIQHKMIHNGQKKYSCQQCGKLVYTISQLKAHEHTHKEKTHLCEICSKLFNTKNTLTRHINTFHNESPNYKCEVCDKSFKEKGSLVRHMRVHTGEKKFKCKDCNKAFVLSYQLKRHMDLHNGLKPFSCNVCDYTCKRKAYLTAHMRTHTGQKPYKCTLCDKAFTQSQVLKSHLKRHQKAQSAVDALT